MSELQANMDSEVLLTALFKKLGIITDKFFGEVRFVYIDGRIVHIKREQSLKLRIANV
uniref:Uncharacterized protein n=1 Tax=viral metagenome TaxID=1070528 RepID=A0A6M3IT47_9ZZZZ